MPLVGVMRVFQYTAIRLIGKKTLKEFSGPVKLGIGMLK